MPQLQLSLNRNKAYALLLATVIITSWVTPLRAEPLFHPASGCYLDDREDLLRYNRGLKCHHEKEAIPASSRQEQPLPQASGNPALSAESAQANTQEQPENELSPEERHRRAVQKLEEAFEKGKNGLETGLSKAKEGWSKVEPYWQSFSDFLGQIWSTLSGWVESFGSWLLLQAIPAVVATIAVIILLLLKLIIILALLIKTGLFWIFGTALPGVGHYLVWLMIIALLVWLFRRSGFAGYSLYRLNRTVLSAEFGILEAYRRWQGSDGGDRKVSKNLSLFQALVAPTIEINRNRTVEMALINMGASPEPVNVFKDEAAEVYASRQAENEKASKRKKAVRLSMGLYRLVIFGEPRVAFEALERMSQSDRDMVAPGVISLVRSPDLTHPVTLNLARWLWRYPSTLTARKEDGTVLRGLDALNFMEMEIAGVDSI